MAEDIKTFREAAIEIRSARTEMRVYAGCAGFVATIVIGLIVWGFTTGFEKIDQLEASSARIEATLATLVSDSQQIKKNTSLASIAIPEPTADSFTGWVGVQAEKEAETIPALADDKYKDAWIFLPAK